MKIKNFLLFSILSIILSILFSLYNFEKKIIQFFFNEKKIYSDVNKLEVFLKKEVDLIFINLENKKIIEKAFLNFTSNKEENLILILKEWEKFILQETGINFLIESVSLNLENCICNIVMNSRDKIENNIIEMNNFFESLKLTILNEFKNLKNIYFFENNKNFESVHFFNDLSVPTLIENEKSYGNDLFIIPIFENLNDEKVEKKLIKNFFQEISFENNKIKILNSDLYSKNWLNKIYKIDEKLIFIKISKNQYKNFIYLIETNGLNTNFKNEIEKLEVYCKDNNIELFKKNLKCKINILKKNSIILEIYCKNDYFLKQLEGLINIF